MDSPSRITIYLIACVEINSLVGMGMGLGMIMVEHEELCRTVGDCGGVWRNDNGDVRK